VYIPPLLHPQPASLLRGAKRRGNPSAFIGATFFYPKDVFEIPDFARDVARRIPTKVFK
jgi:hypothetical protein